MKKIISFIFFLILCLNFSSCKVIQNEVKKLSDTMKGSNNVTIEETKEETYAFEDDNYSDSKTFYTVTKVVDGDTIYINNETKIRLIGIDTPESVHSDSSKNVKFGKISSNYTKSMLLNKEIEIEYDEEQTDQYGRTLAYVYLDGEMFNLVLAREGYAVAKEYPPNTRYADLLKEAQIEAEKNKRGMWSDGVSIKDCPLKSTNYISY